MHCLFAACLTDLLDSDYTHSLHIDHSRHSKHLVMAKKIVIVSIRIEHLSETKLITIHADDINGKF